MQIQIIVMNSVIHNSVVEGLDISNLAYQSIDSAFKLSDQPESVSLIDFSYIEFGHFK